MVVPLGALGSGTEGTRPARGPALSPKPSLSFLPSFPLCLPPCKLNALAEYEVEGTMLNLKAAVGSDKVEGLCALFH